MHHPWLLSHILWPLNHSTENAALHRRCCLSFSLSLSLAPLLSLTPHSPLILPLFSCSSPLSLPLSYVSSLFSLSSLSYFHISSLSPLCIISSPLSTVSFSVFRKWCLLWLQMLCACHMDARQMQCIAWWFTLCNKINYKIATDLASAAADAKVTNLSHAILRGNFLQFARPVAFTLYPICSSSVIYFNVCWCVSH